MGGRVEGGRKGWGEREEEEEEEVEEEGGRGEGGGGGSKEGGNRGVLECKLEKRGVLGKEAALCVDQVETTAETVNAHQSHFNIALIRNK